MAQREVKLSSIQASFAEDVTDAYIYFLLGDDTAETEVRAILAHTRMHASRAQLGSHMFHGRARSSNPYGQGVR